MKKMSATLILPLFLFTCHASPVTSQERPACASREQVVKRLEEKFGETLHSIGLQRSDGVVEVFASDTTGTWTILMTQANGVSCLLAAGSYWMDALPPTPKKKGSPA